MMVRRAVAMGLELGIDPSDDSGCWETWDYQSIDCVMLVAVSHSWQSECSSSVVPSRLEAEG